MASTRWHTDLIAIGDSVVFDENGQQRSTMIIRTKGRVRIGKSWLPLSAFIGAPFGAVYTVDGDKLTRVEACPTGEWASNRAIREVSRNNAELLDRNEQNQKLSAEDIRAMKLAGASGQDIVDALCTNSATFETKTEFAQDKYRRKKARKYLVVLTLRRPSARQLCQEHYDKAPERVFNLRPDSLAIAMSLANVAAGSRVLIVDACMGLVIAAVSERLGGQGAAVALRVDGQAPPRADAMRSLNPTAQQAATLHVVGLADLLGLQAAAVSAEGGVPLELAGDAGAAQLAPDVDIKEAPAQAALPAEAQQPAPDAVPAAGTGGEPSTASGGVTEQAGIANGTGGRKRGRDGVAQDEARAPQQDPAARRQALARIAHEGFTSCIVAAPRLDVTSLMQQVWPLLAPSASFAMYSPWPQPLAECLSSLQRSKQAVMLQLHESWLRPYQVLPSRTHPEMVCAGTGGFLMSGIKVVSEEPRNGAATTTETGKPAGPTAAAADAGAANDAGAAPAAATEEPGDAAQGTH